MSRLIHTSARNLAFSLRKPNLNSSSEKVVPLKNNIDNNNNTNNNNSENIGNVAIRTRFAPSPTGFLHLGSLRTALFNYLLAVGHRKNNPSINSKFLLRLEDTDRNRLVENAESNLYDTLDKLGLHADESPKVGGPYAPYRQSDRGDIYDKYAQKLLKEKKAYRCFCSKDRLNGLRDSARLLKPPTTVSYDRHCLEKVSFEESETRAKNGEKHTIRLIAPSEYPIFEDILHGTIDLQPQINQNDPRFDDPVLLKSDGMPTYHFANVIDDYLMKITHVIRGEEWLASTPKHVALYKAFGWYQNMPKFVHIPLLTNLEGKKLSKRHGDVNVWSLLEKGYEVEAIINFAVLFGWNPKRELGTKTSDVYTLQELEDLWTGPETLLHLTKSNVKVDWKKLDFLNKQHLHNKFNSSKTRDAFIKEITINYLPKVNSLYSINLNSDRFSEIITKIIPSLSKLTDITDPAFQWVFNNPAHYSTYQQEMEHIQANAQLESTQTIKLVMDEIEKNIDELTSSENLTPIIKSIVNSVNSNSDISEKVKNKHIFHIFRHSLSRITNGMNLVEMIKLIGQKESKERFNLLNKYINCK
ncbi:glutamate--tRNA ligase [Martiniozyma asiatica (nom. inval.)]|nr:glutamate--tRNA ligase [Martiniozyma asiatica]